MDKFYFDIQGKWSVLLAYNITEGDTEEIGGWLDALGARRRDVEKALRVALATNCGFTYSSDELRMSLTVISPASTDAEFWNTTVHEIDHIQSSVCEHYDVALGTEDAAYLQGYIMSKIYRGIKNRSILTD